MVVHPTRRAGFRRWGLAAALLASAPALAGQVAPGARFPSFPAGALTGGALPQTAGRVVLVDFWASWCAPCRASFPAYSQLQADFAARGFVIVAVSVDDNPGLYASFVAKHKPGFATLDDPTHALVRVVEVPTMPTSYLVDRAGRVRFVHAGFRAGQTERELRKEIEGLLAEAAPPP